MLSVFMPKHWELLATLCEQGAVAASCLTGSFRLASNYAGRFYARGAS